MIKIYTSAATEDEACCIEDPPLSKIARLSSIYQCPQIFKYFKYFLKQQKEIFRNNVMRQLQVSAFHTAFIFLNKLKKLTFNEKKKSKILFRQTSSYCSKLLRPLTQFRLFTIFKYHIRYIFDTTWFPQSWPWMPTK